MMFSRVERCLIPFMVACLFFEHGLSVVSQSVGFTISSFMMALSLIFFALRGVSSLEMNVGHYILSSIFVYWCYSSFTAIWTPSFDDALFSIVKNLWYCFFFLSLFLFLMKKGEEWCVPVINNAGFVSYLILSSLGLYSYFTGDVVRESSYDGRFSVSPFADYNMYVLMLGLSLLMLFWRVRFSEVKVVVYLLLLAILIFLAFLAGSRRSLIFYSPVLLLYPFFLSKRRVSFKALGVISLVFVLFFTFMPSAPSLGGGGDEKANLALEKRIERSLGVLSFDKDVSSTRVERWTKAVEIIDESSVNVLIFGNGHRSYYSHSSFIRDNGGKDHPHNLFLSSLIEGGVFKLLALLMVIFFILYGTLKCRLKADRFFFLSFLSLWVLTVLISGEEFFMAKQIYFMVSLLLFVLLNDARSNSFPEKEKGKN